MQYQDDYIARLVEQLGSMIRQASMRFGDAKPSVDSLDVTGQAIALVTDMDATLFLSFSPQSMVSFLEISGFDDRLVIKLAEALELQADILEADGAIVLAGVRREQASAVVDSIDPARAN